MAAKNTRDGAIKMGQDVEVSAARLSPGQQAAYRLKPGRHAWLQMARGGAALNGAALGAGDGAAVGEEEILELKAIEEAEARFSTLPEIEYGVLECWLRFSSITPFPFRVDSRSRLA